MDMLKELLISMRPKQWYKYTLFGYQDDANGVDAEQQFHYTGFSKTEITQLLEDNGFVIDYMENY